MKLKIFILIFCAVFMLLPTKLFAQSKTYLGKKLVVKTNVINGIRLGFNNADVEVALSRRFSLNGFFELHNF